MSWNATNPVTEDAATKADDYDRLWDDAMALADIQLERSFGGSRIIAYTDTSYVDAEASKHLLINGTNLGGLTVVFEFMCLVVTGTGYAQIYDVTAAGALASSEVSFTNTSADRAASGSLTLPTANHEYKLQIKGSAAGALPRVWEARFAITG